MTRYLFDILIGFSAGFLMVLAGQWFRLLTDIYRAIDGRLR